MSHPMLAERGRGWSGSGNVRWARSPPARSQRGSRGLGGMSFATPSDALAPLPRYALDLTNLPLAAQLLGLPVDRLERETVFWSGRRDSNPRHSAWEVAASQRYVPSVESRAKSVQLECRIQRDFDGSSPESDDSRVHPSRTTWYRRRPDLAGLRWLPSVWSTRAPRRRGRIIDPEPLGREAWSRN